MKAEEKRILLSDLEEARLDLASAISMCAQIGWGTYVKELAAGLSSVVSIEDDVKRIEPDSEPESPLKVLNVREEELTNRIMDDPRVQQVLVDHLLSTCDTCGCKK
jgi:hypothetical protein